MKNRIIIISCIVVLIIIIFIIGKGNSNNDNNYNSNSNSNTMVSNIVSNSNIISNPNSNIASNSNVISNSNSNLISNNTTNNNTIVSNSNNAVSNQANSNKKSNKTSQVTSNKKSNKKSNSNKISNSNKQSNSTTTYTCPKEYILNGDKCTITEDALLGCPEGLHKSTGGCISFSEKINTDTQSCDENQVMIRQIGFGVPDEYYCYPLHDEILYCYDNDAKLINGKCIKTITATKK